MVSKGPWIHISSEQGLALSLCWPRMQPMEEAASTLSQVSMEKSCRVLVPDFWHPGPMLSPGPPPNSPGQVSPRLTFSSSAFCQRRKMRRKQRSRAPKEVKKCCRREKEGCKGVGERRGQREGKLHRHPYSVPDLHPDVSLHSSLHSFHQMFILGPALHWTLESP